MSVDALRPLSSCKHLAVYRGRRIAVYIVLLDRLGRLVAVDSRSPREMRLTGAYSSVCREMIRAFLVQRRNLTATEYQALRETLYMQGSSVPTFIFALHRDAAPRYHLELASVDRLPQRLVALLRSRVWRSAAAIAAAGVVAVLLTSAAFRARTKVKPAAASPTTPADTPTTSPAETPASPVTPPAEINSGKELSAPKFAWTEAGSQTYHVIPGKFQRGFYITHPVDTIHRQLMYQKTLSDFRIITRLENSEIALTKSVPSWSPYTYPTRLNNFKLDEIVSERTMEKTALELTVKSGDGKNRVQACKYSVDKQYFSAQVDIVGTDETMSNLTVEFEFEAKENCNYGVRLTPSDTSPASETIYIPVEHDLKVKHTFDGPAALLASTFFIYRHCQTENAHTFNADTIAFAGVGHATPQTPRSWFAWLI